jgi:mgtE-like transporter
MRRGFGRILAFLVAERRTIGQGFAALLVASLGSLVAGIVLGSITGTLEALPGLIVLVPAAIGMRGNIFGALGSRLGTSIHVGLYAPGRTREGVLYQNVYAVTVLTFAISLLLGVLARTLSLAFGVESISVMEFAVISIVGGLISSLFVGAFTLALARAAYRRGWDLDSVAAPVITAAGDMVTIPSLFLATFLIGIPFVTPSIVLLATVLTVGLLIRSLLSDLPLTRRIVRESVPILAVAGAVDIFAGLFVEARLDRLLVYPVLLVLIPPFLEAAGALGGILSARLASKLHLGVITPRGKPEPAAWLDITLIFVFAALTFFLVGVAADVAAALVGLASPGPLTVIGVSMVAGLLATLMTVVVSYYAAVATYRLGLDPDNHGIPMITSSMDFVGVLALAVGLAALGVGA